MSDSEDSIRNVNDTDAQKKRRIQRACDLCRRKKIKCDGPTSSDGTCTTCRGLGKDCLYVEATKRRGPPRGYVESIEKRVERMESLLNRLAPGSDFTNELGAHIDRETFSLDEHKKHEPNPSSASSSLSHRNPPHQTPHQAPRQSPHHHTSSASSPLHSTPVSGSPNCGNLPEPLKPWATRESPSGGADEDGGEAKHEDDEPEDEEEKKLWEGIQQMSMLQKATGDGHITGFMGKSSGFSFINSIRDWKYDEGNDRFVVNLTSQRRARFWKAQPWESMTFRASPPVPLSSIWPAPDLATTLIDLYFEHVNPHVPLLHRPTFDRQFASKLYSTDKWFAGSCLAVFAHAARFCDDERVYPSDEEGDDAQEMKSYGRGFKYINGFLGIEKNWNDLCTLFELQSLALLGTFQAGHASPRVSWSLLGHGIRCCLDLGLHRRHVIRSKPDGELWKRAFWTFYILDRSTSGLLGRPLMLHDEDIDAEYPLAVDDEFWETGNPETAFKQPKDRPSIVAAFIATIKLQSINGYCLRTIYSINKSRLLLSLDSIEAQQQIVSELDSALNQWLADQVPPHLKWDPANPNPLHLKQSALLMASFYATQIFVHRPFIKVPDHLPRTAFPSLAICTNAARSGTHILDHARKRNKESFMDVALGSCIQGFTFGIVLLINVWGGKKGGSVGDPLMALSDVNRILSLFTYTESTFALAGRLKDILGELVSQTDVAIKLPNPSDSNKRSRDLLARDDQPLPPPPPRSKQTLTASTIASGSSEPALSRKGSRRSTTGVDGTRKASGNGRAIKPESSTTDLRRVTSGAGRPSSVVLSQTEEGQDFGGSPTQLAGRAYIPSASSRASPRPRFDAQPQQQPIEELRQHPAYPSSLYAPSYPSLPTGHQRQFFPELFPNQHPSQPQPFHSGTTPSSFYPTHSYPSSSYPGAFDPHIPQFSFGQLDQYQQPPQQGALNGPFTFPRSSDENGYAPFPVYNHSPLQPPFQQQTNVPSSSYPSRQPQAPPHLSSDPSQQQSPQRSQSLFPLSQPDYSRSDQAPQPSSYSSSSSAPAPFANDPASSAPFIASSPSSVMFNPSSVLLSPTTDLFASSAQPFDFGSSPSQNAQPSAGANSFEGGHWGFDDGQQISLGEGGGGGGGETETMDLWNGLPTSFSMVGWENLAWGGDDGNGNGEGSSSVTPFNL